MNGTSFSNFFKPTLRLDKIKNLSSLKQLKDEEGFTLVELIVVVMMIGILSSIAIPQFMTAADKAKQKEATGIVAGLVKGATAYQTEYGVLPANATQLSEYAKFQECTADDVLTRGGAACKEEGNLGPVTGDEKLTFFTPSGNYFVTFEINENGTFVSGDGGTTNTFRVKADPSGPSFGNVGSAVTGCYNPVDSTSEVYEFPSNQKGPQDFRDC